MRGGVKFRIGTIGAILCSSKDRIGHWKGLNLRNYNLFYEKRCAERDF
jgi:hypothetical protein